MKAADVLRHVAGALKLFRFDGTGLTYMDQGRQGTITSFFAAVLALPVFFVLQAGFIAGAVQAIGLVLGAVLVASVYATYWLAFPVIYYDLSRVLGAKRETFFQLITALNWLVLVHSYVVVVMTALTRSELLPTALATGLGLAVDFYILSTAVYTVRAVTGMNGLAAIGLVIFDLCLTLTITLWSRGAIGMVPGAGAG